MGRRRHKSAQRRQATVPGTPRPVVPGTLAQGANTAPVSSYRQPPLGTGVLFPPGDPIRPVAGLDDGTPQQGPRGWGYPAVMNAVPVPRHTETTAFQQLRNLAALYDGVQLCEAVIFRVLQRLEMQIVPREECLRDGDDPASDRWRIPARQMLEWFQEPDHRGTSLDAWMIAAMRDILELDALGIYHRRTKSGALFGLECVAGDTIACLVDEGGRAPRAPRPAFAQILYGAPAGLFSLDEMDYLRETVRTDSMYGISRVERILLRVNQALRKQHYDLTRYTDGATPEGVLQTNSPELFTMTPGEVHDWEQMFNAVLAGNDALRVRAKVVPPGWSFTSTRQADIATPFDEFLLHVTVAAFGLTMDELSFTATSNRSVGQTQENVVYRNAVRPTTEMFARYFTQRIIQRYDGQPLSRTCASVSRAGAPTRSTGQWDARFRVTWAGIDEPDDFNAKVTAASELVHNGMMGPTEAKRWLRLPVKADETPIPAFVVTGKGIVFLQEAYAESQAAQAAPAAAAPAAPPAEEHPNALGDSGHGPAGRALPPTAGAHPTLGRLVAGDGTASGWPTPSALGATGDGGGRSGGAERGAGPDGVLGGVLSGRGPGGDGAQPGLRELAHGLAHGLAPAPRTQGLAHTDETALEDVSDEWARYREKALRAVKRGRPAPTWVATHLPAALHHWVEVQLRQATTPDAVRAIFEAARAREQDAATPPVPAPVAMLGRNALPTETALLVAAELRALRARVLADL